MSAIRTNEQGRATSRRLTRVVPLALVALAATAGLLFAGPLNPPPGPLASTQSVDVETLPGDATCKHLISQPGAYHMTRNITGVAGRNGISITTSCASFDLKGFALEGVPGSLDGISGDVGANKKGIAISNGCIHGWGAQGIDMGNTATFGGTIEKIRAIDNGSIGIQTGIGYIVTNCVATGNGAAGISMAPGSTVIGCDSSKNNGDGFFTNIGGTIQDCTAYQNVGNGIQVTAGCKVIGNNCRENGFGAGSGAGILAGNANGSGGNRIEANNCTGGDFGVRVTSTGNFVAKNTSGTNTTNWVVTVSPNAVMQIIDLRTAVLAPINGDSGGGWDGGCCNNFSY